MDECLQEEKGGCRTECADGCKEWTNGDLSNRSPLSTECVRVFWWYGLSVPTGQPRCIEKMLAKGSTKAVETGCDQELHSASRGSEQCCICAPVSGK